jgi:hypothetical protein
VASSLPPSVSSRAPPQGLSSAWASTGTPRVAPSRSIRSPSLSERFRPVDDALLDGEVSDRRVDHGSDSRVLAEEVRRAVVGPLCLSKRFITVAGNRLQKALGREGVDARTQRGA